MLIHLSCLEDDVFIFRSSASSTSENTTQSMFYPFIKNRTTRLCNNYERIPSKDQRNKHRRTEHGTRKGTSQFPIIFIIAVHSMRQYINKAVFDEIVVWLKSLVKATRPSSKPKCRILAGIHEPETICDRLRLVSLFRIRHLLLVTSIRSYLV